MDRSDRKGQLQIVKGSRTTRPGRPANPLGPGSRLRLYHCACEPPVKVRVATDFFQARCLKCNEDFKPQVTNGRPGRWQHNPSLALVPYQPPAEPNTTEGL